MKSSNSPKSQAGTNSETVEAGGGSAVMTLGDNYLALQSEMHEMAGMIDEYLEGGLQSNDLERIKVPPGGGLQWEIPGAGGGEMVSTFDGIIVGVQTTRSYWAEEFSGGNVPPNCSSRDGQTGVGDPGGECETCPKNHWGSGRNGVGTACQERKMVYILRPEDALPVVLSLPITSIKLLRKYQFRLLSKRTPPHAVVTRFGLERTKSGGGILYSLVTFSAVGPLSPQLTPIAKAYASTIKTALGIQSDTLQKPVADVDADGIPESDPPFGSFAKQNKPDATQEDEIPF